MPNFESIIQSIVTLLAGGIGAKAIDYFQARRQVKRDEMLGLRNVNIDLKKLALEGEEKFRNKLLEWIESLEAQVKELDLREQACWDKYNQLFKMNAEMNAELNFVKRILKESGHELMKLQPTTTAPVLEQDKK